MSILKRETITRVYSGLPGCACGCRGTYSQSKAMVTRVLKELEKAVRDGRVVDDMGGLTSEGENFVYFDSANSARTYTVYFKKETL